MIDEIDKMGADFRGDPASAMLEVLDPAQNDSFRDHYLDLEFDLSDVVFIATANVLDTIPGPLLDRMETIELSGYTLEEKKHIARRYLVGRQIAANGLRPPRSSSPTPALAAIIEEYTREAGVRNLERQIGTICRKVARDVAEGKAKGKVRVSAKKARELLGRRRVFIEQRRRTKDPGVATGLAWTPAGGDVLFIEATAMPGAGKLTITGQLGDVMKESAQAALSYVRGHWAEIDPKLGEDWFAEHDIHVHVPAGAVPKDGPSAGVAMTVALASLISGRPVRNDVAMTGEVTLTGQVLPIGGLKEKSLAAQRAGIKRVIVPGRNEGDVAEIPEPELGGLEFVFVDEVSAGARRSTELGGGEVVEAATLGRGGLGTYLQAIREALRARSRAFWIVAGLTALGAVLRFLTLGVQSYHHDEIVTASRILRGDFGHAMNAVGFSESAPPLYYALAWIWTQFTGTGEFGLRSLSALAGVVTIPVVYLIGIELRGRRAGLMAAALAAVNPMLLWYSQEARAYSLLVAALRASRCSTSCARCRHGRRRDFDSLGRLLGPRPRHPLLRRLPDPRRGLSCSLRRRGGASLRRGRDHRRLLACCWRRWRSTRCRSATPSGSAPSRSGTGVWETAATFVSGETGDIIGQPERPALAFVPLALCLAALRAARPPRRAARSGGRRRAAAGGRPRSRSASRWRWRCSPPSKDYVLARNLMPALVPLLLGGRDRASLCASARRLGDRDRRRAGGLLARLLHLGQRLAGPAAAGLGRRRQPARRTAGAAGDGHLDPGRGAAAPLPLDRLDPGPRRRTLPLAGARNRLHLRRARRRAPSRRMLGPGLPRKRPRRQRTPCSSAATQLPGPRLAPLRLRRLRDAPLNFRTTGVLLDGVGPS